MNIHEIIRPSKRMWRGVRERQDYEYVRQGYNELKISQSAGYTPYYDAIAQDILKLGVGLDARIIDAGCGGGHLAKQIKAAGFRHVSAFDISDDNVTATAPYVDRAFRSSCEEIAESDGVYDVVVSSYVIEHLMDVQKALGEFYRILRPGGYLYLTTDNSWWQTIMAIRGWVTPKSKRYTRLVQPIDGDFSPWELRRILIQSGFRPHRFFGLGGVPIGDKVVSKIVGPTTAHPLFKYFTTRMGFIVQKP